MFTEIVEARHDPFWLKVIIATYEQQRLGTPLAVASNGLIHATPAEKPTQ